jgi:hypothetical protein
MQIRTTIAWSRAMGNAFKVFCTFGQRRRNLLAQWCGRRAIEKCTVPWWRTRGVQRTRSTSLSVYFPQRRRRCCRTVGGRLLAECPFQRVHCSCGAASSCTKAGRGGLALPSRYVGSPESVAVPQHSRGSCACVRLGSPARTEPRSGSRTPALVWHSRLPWRLMTRSRGPTCGPALGPSRLIPAGR